MTNSNIEIARELLLKWLTCRDNKLSYESIRKNCEYLDQAYGLGLENNAMWAIFQPLLRTGVVEFAGNDCYAVSPSVAIEANGYFIYNTPLTQKEDNYTDFTGIYRTLDCQDIDGFPIVTFNAESVLKHIPTVKDVVDLFQVSIQDLSNVEYYHHIGSKGLTKRIDNGGISFFIIPELCYQKEVPGRAINPDAFNIAYCYSTSINGLFTGKYCKQSHILQMQSFGLPIAIERVLFLESMLNETPPEETGRYKQFYHISHAAIKQLNRILCNTIKYE